MTHLHYAPATTEDWLESDSGRTDFLDWLAGYADDQLLGFVRDALIGWAPLHRLDTIETTREWLHEIPVTHPAAIMLHSRYVEDWIGSEHEHDRFHRWADRTDRTALCGGCWT